MDRGAWRATVHGVAMSWTQSSDCAHSTGEERRVRVCDDLFTLKNILAIKQQQNTDMYLVEPVNENFKIAWKS